MWGGLLLRRLRLDCPGLSRTGVSGTICSCVRLSEYRRAANPSDEAHNFRTGRLGASHLRARHLGASHLDTARAPFSRHQPNGCSVDGPPAAAGRTTAATPTAGPGVPHGPRVTISHANRVVDGAFGMTDSEEIKVLEVRQANLAGHGTNAAGRRSPSRPRRRWRRPRAPARRTAPQPGRKRSAGLPAA